MELFIVLVIFAILFVFKLYFPQIKGKWGEMEVANILSLLPEDEYKVINDVIIKNNGYTSQIDHIVVSIYGIFVIETKNYTGLITGYENSKNWVQNIYGNKYRLYNPIKQNKGHILALKNGLYIIEDNFIPIIAFSDNCLLNVKTKTSVIYISQIFDEIKKYTETKFDKTLIESIVERIKSININSSEIRQQHVDEIENNLQRERDNLQYGICPKCGAMLVLRQGKYGKFYGCSNYPKCHYTYSGR